MNPYNLSLLLFAYCSFFIGLLVLLKRNDEVGKLYFAFSLLVTGWGIGNSWMYSNDFGAQIALFGTRVAHVCSILIVPTWLHFIYLFLGISDKKIPMLRIAYIIAFLIEPFAFSRWFIPNVKSIVGFNYFTHWSWIYVIYTILFFVFVTYAFVRVFEVWRIQSGNKKKQLSFFMFAALMGFINGSLAFVPVYDIPLPQYNLFLIPFYPFLMAYAMMRQGLLDQEEVLAIHRDKLALIGLISSSINHELKNPLFILQELAKKTAGELANDPRRTNENLSSAVSKMSDQIARMRTLVERLGDFGRPNENTQTEEVDIRDGIENALYFASQELRYHNIQIVKEFCADLQKLRGVRSQFEEIFLNLIINAYHAMPNGGTLTVIVSPAGAKQSLKITISDTGTGIAKDDLKNIFKPFYTTKQKTGTGLGLHIVKTLVEQNGGTISVSSEPGKGTRFSISFKL